MEEEDRSRNVVIFDLNEEDNEKLNERVAEVFESIGQKPRAEACRVGQKKSKDSVCPVKVELSSSLIVVKQFLVKQFITFYGTINIYHIKIDSILVEA